MSVGEASRLLLTGLSLRGDLMTLVSTHPRFSFVGDSLRPILSLPIGSGIPSDDGSDRLSGSGNDIALSLGGGINPKGERPGPTEDRNVPPNPAGNGDGCDEGG